MQVQPLVGENIHCSFNLKNFRTFKMRSYWESLFRSVDNFVRMIDVDGFDCVCMAILVTCSVHVHVDGL